MTVESLLSEEEENATEEGVRFKTQLSKLLFDEVQGNNDTDSPLKEEERDMSSNPTIDEVVRFVDSNSLPISYLFLLEVYCINNLLISLSLSLF